MPAPIALLTDFGLSDPYVGQMRGVLAGLAPGAPVLDVSHGVEPYNLPQGAFFLAASLPHFPEGTVFMAVVDPGVGSARRIVGLSVHGRIILAPDNGLAGLVLTGTEDVRAYDLSAHAEGGEVSATFHGRDVFAPLAARIALGEPLAALGRELDPASLERPEWASPAWDAGKAEASASVLHVDRFGNCVLNLPMAPWMERLCSSVAVSIIARGHDSTRAKAVRTYADLAPGALGLLAGSQGYLELSMNQASAADLLGARCGTALVLTVREGGA